MESTAHSARSEESPRRESAVAASELGNSADQPRRDDPVGIDEQTFRQIMGGFPAGVAIVTTADTDGQPFGLTTTAVCSVSADPPLLLVCIAHSSRTLPQLRAAGSFIVHFMDEDAVTISSTFASKSPDKFSRVPWSYSSFGNPRLGSGVLAWAECEIAGESAMGDHSVITGHIKGGEGMPPDNPSRSPLVYFNRMFGNWNPASV